MSETYPSFTTQARIRRWIIRRSGFEDGLVHVFMRERQLQVQIMPPAKFSHDQLAVCNQNIQKILWRFGIGDGTVLFKHPHSA